MSPESGRTAEKRRKRPRVVSESSAGREGDRTRSDRKWLAVAVQRAATKPGRTGAQHAGGPSQTLPHRVCATHGWSVRRVQRTRPPPAGTVRASAPSRLSIRVGHEPCRRRCAHGAESNCPLHGPGTVTPLSADGGVAAPDEGLSSGAVGCADRTAAGHYGRTRRPPCSACLDSSTPSEVFAGARDQCTLYEQRSGETLAGLSVALP